MGFRKYLPTVGKPSYSDHKNKYQRYKCARCRKVFEKTETIANRFQCPNCKIPVSQIKG